MNKKILVVTKSFINKYIKHKPKQYGLYEQQYNKFHYNQGLEVQKILQKYFPQTKTVQLHDFHSECIDQQENFKFPDEPEYIITLGGDGTFLSCTHCINKQNQIILGINSNPTSSVGHLCSFSYDTKVLDRVFKRIHDNDFKTYKRKRGVVKMYNEQHKKVEQFVFLNDVFFGTKDPGSTLRYNFHNKKNNLLMENLKSTGCIFYTGTGSTAWVKTMNNSSLGTVSKILRLYDKSITQDQVNQVYQQYISSTIFDPRESKMGYLHRELYNNKLGLEGIEGYGDEFFIQIKSTNAFMAFDGLHVDLQRGVDISITMSEEYDLNCFDFYSN